MDDKDILQLVADTLGTVSSIAKQFFDRLTSGSISEAKRTFPSIGNSIAALNGALTKFRDVFQKQNVLAGLISTKNSLFNTLNILKEKFDAQAGLTDAEFDKDPATYTVLLTDEFKPFIGQIINTANKEKARIDAAIEALQPKQRGISFIPPDVRVERDDEYENFKREYPNMVKAIETSEQRIQTYPYTDNLHEILKRGPWAGYRHAWVFGFKDYRIIYSWEGSNNLLLYRKIGTHQELGLD